MSNNSIRAIDLFCRATNWDRSLENAFPEEAAHWAKQRDRAILAFRKAMQKTTRDEFLRGRWGTTPVAERIRQWDEMVRLAG
jgi:hypothetical protein